MAELVVVGFGSPQDADHVLTELTRLKTEYLIDLEDAVVAIRDADGSVRIKQGVNLVRLGATSGLSMLMGFPRTTLWGLALLLGVDLMAHGMAWLSFAWLPSPADDGKPERP